MPYIFMSVTTSPVIVSAAPMGASSSLNLASIAARSLTVAGQDSDIVVRNLKTGHSVTYSRTPHSLAALANVYDGVVLATM